MGTAHLNVNGLGFYPPGRGWSIKQFATSANISDSTAASSSARVAIIANNKTKYLPSKTAILEHGVNRISGLIDDTDAIQVGSEVSFTLRGYSSLLNVEVSAPPVGNTAASEVFSQYISLATDLVSTEWLTDRNPVVTFRGWEGNLWENLRWMAAALRLQVTMRDSSLVVRDLDSAPILNIQSIPNAKISVNPREIAERINVWYDNAEYVDSLGTTARNYDTNPSVEVNASGWSSSLVIGAGVAIPGNRSNLTSYRGTYSYSTSITPLVDQNGTRGRSSARATKEVDVPESEIPVGQPVYVNAWGRVAGGNSAPGTPGSSYQSNRSVRLYLRWVNNAGTVLASVNGGSTVANSTQFANRSLSLVRPAGATRVRVVMEGARTDTISPAPTWLAHNYYWDAWMVSNKPGAYFDGSQPGAIWDGTPNASTSSRITPETRVIYSAREDGNRIFSVSEGQVVPQLIFSDAYALSIVQPVQTDSVNPGKGQYHVLDREGKSVPAAQWYAYGGRVDVEIGQEPGSLLITLTGPYASPPGYEGPYKLATPNENAALSVIGTGVFTNPQMLSMLTGADPQRVVAPFAPEVNTPFVSDLANAYQVGSWPASIAADGLMSLEFSLPLSETITLGLVEGSLVLFDDLCWHITSVNYTRDGCFFAAEWFTTMGRFEEAWNGIEISEFDELWDGWTAGDVQRGTLRKDAI